MSDIIHVQSSGVSNWWRRKMGLDNIYKAARRIDSYTLGEPVRVCPGKHHAWFESPVGLIRKPI